MNERYAVVTVEVKDVGLRQHAIDLELAEQMTVSSQVQVFHQIRLEVVEVAVKEHLDRLFWVFWWMKVDLRHLLQVNVES